MSVYRIRVRRNYRYPELLRGTVQYAGEDRGVIQITLGRIVSGTEVTPNTGTETAVR